MAPADNATTRRRIPRPWLDKRQPSEQDHPFVLLDRPRSLIQSFLKLGWCCDPMKEEKLQLKRPILFSEPILTPPSYNKLQHSSSSQKSQRQEHYPCANTASSFGLEQNNQPTVIYVIQGNPSTVPPTPEEIGSYLSSIGRQVCHSTSAPYPLPLNADHHNSCDHTSMTSLSMDDSMFLSSTPRSISTANSHDFFPPQPCQSVDTVTRSRTFQVPNRIPRPPRVSTKSQTFGTTDVVPGGLSFAPRPQSASSSPTSLSSVRPPGGRERAVTTGSVTMNSWHSSRPQRELHCLVEKFRQETKEDNHDDDRDYNDDCSTLPSHCGEGGSPLFPHLNDQSGNLTVMSPSSEDSELCEPEVYLPKCSVLEDDYTSSGVVLSGWVAFSMGDALLHKQSITRKNIGYLSVDNNRPNELLIQQPPNHHHFRQNYRKHSKNYTYSSSHGQATSENEYEHPMCNSTMTLRIKVPSNVLVQTVESHGGRSVVLMHDNASANTTKNRILCTLMPINLSSNKFCPTQGKIMKSPSSLVPHASIEQHDAALFLWFGLDGWIRQRANKFSTS